MARPRSPRATEPPADTTGLLDLDQAIIRLGTSRPTFYRWLRSGRLKGLKVGRQWRFRAADLEAFVQGESGRSALTADITPLLEGLAQRLEAAGQPAGPPNPAADPAAVAVERMIHLGLVLRADELHLEPQPVGPAGAQLRLRYRIDGRLALPVAADLRLLPALVEQWKRLAGCDLHEHGLPQDGRVVLPAAEGEPYDLRVSFLPAAGGEALCARYRRNGADLIIPLDRLPFGAADRAILDAALTQPWGMIVCTGPVGSGLTTTMYACLERLATPEAKVMSVEDPIDVLLPGVTQVAANPRLGLTSAHILRSFLRSSPDAIMVGQVRDRETLLVAAQCAQENAMVLLRLHAEDAAAGLVRLAELGGDVIRESEAVRLVVGQRLVRKLCPHCSVPCPVAPEQIEAAVRAAPGCDAAALRCATGWRRAVGCSRCAQIGHRGRTMVSEMLRVTPEITAALRRGAASDELRAIAVGQGMVSLVATGVQRAAAGEISLDEALRCRMGD